MALFKARVSIGCLILGRCAFITVTYKVVEARRQNAAYVPKDWKALWRRLPELRSQLKWLRVMEVTKLGMPHHHLVMGPVPDGMSIRCYGRQFDWRRFQRSFDTCDCLSHVLSRAWALVTGDSFIVHTVPVVGAEGAGSYMAKYLGKTFGSEQRMKELGMKRRWSSSRGWPGNGRMRLKPTEEGDWYETVYRKSAPSGEEIDKGTFEKTGSSDEMVAYFKAKREKSVVSRMKRLANVTNDGS